MWRIYSSNQEGIKLCSTVRKVFDALYTQVDDGRVNCFAGLVRYVPEEQIVALMQHEEIANAMLLNPTGQLQARTLLLKRLEFSHEAEVRFVRRISSHDQLFTEDYPSFAFDMNALIERIVLDPRCDDSGLARQSEALRAAGYEGAIERSRLYQLPAMTIRIRDTPPSFHPSRTIWDLLTTAVSVPLPDEARNDDTDDGQR